MDRVNEQTRTPKNPSRLTLFDSDGLPWSSRLEWGWLLALVAIIWFALGPVIGMYLGLWLRTKSRSALVFNMYL